jgi:ubiquinol-cytochrome c reductase iron-sulfur subunit
MTEPTLNGHEKVTVLDAADPHLQPLAKNPGWAEWIVGLSFLLGIAGIIAYAVVYWLGGQTQLEGVFLGVGFFSMGFGLTAWGKYLLPQGPFVEQRHSTVSSPADREAMAAAIVDRGGSMVKRRPVLTGLLAAGSGVLGVVLMFPLLRSLGNNPGTKADLDPTTSLYATDWKAGSRLVTADGTPVSVFDLEVGGSLTVFPEGYTTDQDVAVDQTMLLRPALTSFTTVPGRETWAPDGYVAYSKLCTHAGCPVGLYQGETVQLVCPCHQSIFNVLDGAQQVFGPAPRPLPQLALMVDEEGWLRAQGPYDQPVGPGFWERTTT